ncbi:2178_t:CDS:1, partial [Funneliformis geosporum]
MSRGISLNQDFRLLINNPKYSDVEILCEDEIVLYGCRAILAARSDVFENLLYNGMRESHQRQISFPELNSSALEVVLEFIYTGMIKDESLSKNNLFETFNAADFFQLPDLQDLIINAIKKNKENYLPEMLTKVVDTMPLTEDNIFLNLLVEKIVAVPLNTIEFGRLSITALQYLLFYTHEKRKRLATPEYEVFRYSAALVARKISNDAFETLIERLPTLEQIENWNHIENKFITNLQEIAEELEPLVEYIDFRRINGQILVDIIEPLNLIPAEKIFNAYRQIIKSDNTDSNEMRGSLKNEGRFPPGEFRLPLVHSS